MRKFNILLFLFSLFALKAFSQSNWEIKGGVNYTYFDNVESSSPKIGLALGMARTFKSKTNFSFSVGAGFVSRGAILEKRAIEPYPGNLDKQNAYSWDIHGFIGYLELPLFIKYSFPINSKYGLTLFMGPSYSIPLLDLTKFKERKFIEVYDPNNPYGVPNVFQ